jgi:hypothetical protein
VQYRAFEGNINDELVEFLPESSSSIAVSPHAWVSTMGDIGACPNSTDGGWYCAFRRFSTVDGVSYPATSSIEVDTLHMSFALRKQHPNNFVQIMFFGKIAQLLLRPTVTTLEYLLAHVVSVHTHRYFTDELVCNPNLFINQGICQDKMKFDTIDEFLNLANFKRLNYRTSHVVSSVSMHVVIDDESCAVEEESIETCEARQIDTYMNRLNDLRSRYQVRRVYLVTDSHVMIQRVSVETSYNWVYVDPVTNRKLPSLFKFASELYLMQFGDIFIGKLRNDVSKLSYFVLTGFKMQMVPFISVDKSTLACSGANVCHSDLASLESILSTSLECPYLSSFA